MKSTKSAWSISPETIMSHHFRLAKGVPAVVNNAPPYSMYNSPISVHYVPKRRASSADPNKRKNLSKSQRELNDFVNGRNYTPNGGLRIPLPLRSSLTDLVKPKLLEDRNYQPPRRRNSQKRDVEMQESLKNAEKFIRINQFKDGVLSEVIRNNDYSDEFILKVVRIHMEKCAGIVPWNDLEKAKIDLLRHLDVEEVHHRRGSKKDEKKKKTKSEKTKNYEIERIETPDSMDLSELDSPSQMSMKSFSTPTSSSSPSSSSSSTTSSKRSF